MGLATREFLTLGPSHTLTQNTVYGLPARACRIHATLACEVSPDGTTWDALTGIETVGAEAGSQFIRCTTGAPVVTCKAL